MIRVQSARDRLLPASDDAAEMSAFDEFFRHHYPAMVRLVMYTGATLHDAEDAVSTAMVEAYLAWPLLVNPTAWVRTAAIHNFVNDAKRNRRRPALEAQAARRDRTDTPTERVEEPDERDLILAALHELPPAQQRVMALLMDGHRPTEIAEMLGVNPHNVRSNLRHARDRMQRSLKDFDGGE